MRAAVLGVFLFLSTLMPTIGTAQVYRSATPAPQVTAAGADWQAQREPIYFAGNTYYPTGPNVFFDQWVMSRTGTYKGVPLYMDSTLQPYSIIYVPIGGNLLRPYERRRDGELAGTVGNRMPSFPTTRDGEVSVSGATGTIGSAPSPAYTVPAPIPEAEPMVLLETDRPVKTNGSAAARVVEHRRIDPGAEDESRHLDHVGRRAVVSGRRHGAARSGSLRRGRRLPRLPGVPREDARRRRDLRPDGEGRTAHAVSPIMADRRWLRAAAVGSSPCSSCRAPSGSSGG